MRVFQFDNTFSRLPVSFYARLMPQPLQTPAIVSVNESLLDLLGIGNTEKVRAVLLEIAAGQRVPEGAEPLATVYSGHQFGEYVPQLGDGRALLLGEVVVSGQRMDIQLKGSGPTPFSRYADGRAVLRSGIREYLAGEALYYLDIPTTRALCLVDSMTPVYRESPERGATIIRVADSHIRFGHFEFFYYTGQYDQLKILSDYTINRHYPHLSDLPDKYAQFYTEVLQLTAKLVAKWQAAGFCHGVMNTDNMSIAGLTLDYGPYAFIDTFDPLFVCNHSDWKGRYAYNQQPGVAYWNCGRLGQALLPLFDNKPDTIQSIVDQFPQCYVNAYTNECRKKLGLQREGGNDQALFDQLLALLKESKVDYTRFFRALCNFQSLQDTSWTHEFFSDHIENIHYWLCIYNNRLAEETLSSQQRAAVMKRTNPKYILRNYMMQEAIQKAEQHDYQEIDQLLSLISQPYDEQPDNESYARNPPEWSKSIVIGCSS